MVHCVREIDYNLLETVSKYRTSSQNTDVMIDLDHNLTLSFQIFQKDLFLCKPPIIAMSDIYVI
jgi:hypothetical protein